MMSLGKVLGWGWLECAPACKAGVVHCDDVDIHVLLLFLVFGGLLILHLGIEVVEIGKLVGQRGGGGWGRGRERERNCLTSSNSSSRSMYSTFSSSSLKSGAKALQFS